MSEGWRSFRGFTSFFEIYSNEEYNSMNSKTTVLFYSSLTIVMIFFNGNGKYVEKMRKKSIVIVAGVFAMIYVGFTFVDALIRCRFKHVRILDEIALVSAFFSLWCFAFTAFEITSLWYAVGVTIGFLIMFAIICYRGVFAMKRRTDPRVARLIESISDLNTLQAMALMAVVLKPDDAETGEIFMVAMARAAAASETPSVYLSPRRSSSFAGNSSPLPPATTVVSVANLCEMVKKLQV